MMFPQNFHKKSLRTRQDIKLLPYLIVDKGSKPMISVKVKGEDKVMAPEEVSSMVLTKMKETAENYLGKDTGIRKVLGGSPGVFFRCIS